MFKRRSLDPILGGGSLAFCSGPNDCKILTSGLKFPNGLVRGLDGLFYVPSSIDGRIRVWALQANETLLKVDEVAVGMAIDNLSVDANGVIFAAAFPEPLKLVREVRNPAGVTIPGTVFKIRRLGAGNWEIEKILEDREGSTLPKMTTIAVHDVKSGRLFLAGILSSYMTVCEPLPGIIRGNV